jgi:hypothetical protein
MSDPLTRLIEAVNTRRAADQEYRDAITEARKLYPVPVVAKAAGTTRQNIYKLTKEQR